MAEDSLIGKIVFVEGDLLNRFYFFGEHVIVAESGDSIYGISLASSIDAGTVRRFVRSLESMSHYDYVKIVSIRENDNEIDDMIEQLTNFELERPGDFDQRVYENARHSVWLLKNALAQIAKTRATESPVFPHVVPGPDWDDDSFWDDFEDDEDEDEDDDDDDDFDEREIDEKMQAELDEIIAGFFQR